MDFKEKMDMYLADDYDGPVPGPNGISYEMKDRMNQDPDMKLVHMLNIPLIRHLAERADYEGIGKYICGMINKQHMEYDD